MKYDRRRCCSLLGERQVGVRTDPRQGLLLTNLSHRASSIANNCLGGLPKYGSGGGGGGGSGDNTPLSMSSSFHRVYVIPI